METRQISDGIELCFPKKEREAAKLIEAACKRSIAVIEQLWGLRPIARCRVYVMTSWLGFAFRSAPWYARVVYAVFFPFWFNRVRKLWKCTGGWTQTHRSRSVVGIKPPRLIEQGDSRIGELIFIEEPDLEKKVEHITCHELTHALSAHLGLPVWLNEGIAMVAVDRYFGRPVVKTETLELLSSSAGKRIQGKYRSLGEMGDDDLARHYVLGYWAARLLLETRPKLLKELLAARMDHRSIEEQIAAELGFGGADFWSEMERAIVARIQLADHASAKNPIPSTRTT